MSYFMLSASKPSLIVAILSRNVDGEFLDQTMCDCFNVNRSMSRSQCSGIGTWFVDILSCLEFTRAEGFQQHRRS